MVNNFKSIRFRLLPFLFPLAGLSGYLLSKASWAGRTGINLVYREYKFLNVWWQAALAVLVVWLALYFLQWLEAIQASWKRARFYYAAMAAVCLAGAGYTIYDFQTTSTHRMLGARFHWGVYLFFIGWLLILAEGWTRDKNGNVEQ